LFIQVVKVLIISCVHHGVSGVFWGGMLGALLGLAGLVESRLL
jgi:hypothetical protein